MGREVVANECQAVLDVGQDLGDGDLWGEAVVGADEGVVVLGDTGEHVGGDGGFGALEEAAAMEPEEDGD